LAAVVLASGAEDSSDATFDRSPHNGSVRRAETRDHGRETAAAGLPNRDGSDVGRFSIYQGRPAKHAKLVPVILSEAKDLA
jgi:hypothetical protein